MWCINPCTTHFPQEIQNLVGAIALSYSAYWCYCTFVPPGVRVTVAKAFSRVFSWRVINSKRVVGEGGTKDIDSKNALVAMLIKSCLDKQLEVFSNNTRINYKIISGEKSFTFPWSNIA